MTSFHHSQQSFNLRFEEARSAQNPQPSTINFAHELERMAFFIAKTWRDDHPEASPHSPNDFEQCVAYVTAEMAQAASMVGGIAGLEILTGGGSAAARNVCRQVLSS